MGNQSALAAEMLLNDIRAAGQRQRANAELDKAQMYHCGSIAQLSACLDALRALDANHPLLRQEVLDVIDGIGEAAYDGGFQKAWRVKVDPHQIAADLARRRREQLDALGSEISTSEISSRAGGFLWLSTRWTWWGLRFHSEDEALRARDAARAALDEARQADSLATLTADALKAVAKQAAVRPSSTG
jgi:hypothetical protein